MVGQRALQWWMAEHGNDLVRHVFHIPEVNFERIHQHFAHAGLTADQYRHAMAKCLKRRDTEWLAHAGHDIEVGHIEHARNVLAAQESSEQHLVPNTQFRSKLDHRLRLITGACNHEFHIVHFFQDTLGRLDEVLGTLLHGDTTEVQNDLVAAPNGAQANRLRIKIHSVVDHFALGGVHAVSISADVLGEHAHGDHAHGGVHSASFNVVNRLIHVFAGTIKFR